MPTPREGESQSEFMKRCVPMMQDEGMENDQAVAACMNMHRENKGLVTLLSEGKSLDDLTYQSNALKALSKTDDELRVGNYIVLFGGRDLEWIRKGKNGDGSMGEYFTDKTKLESSYTKSGVLYLDWEHGAGKAVDGTDAPGQHDILGKVLWDTAKKDARGVWVERALNRRNEYVKVLEELIENNLIGTSSEAIQEGVKIKKTGEIEAWPLIRDTLTVSPAEPRMLTENVLQAAKALFDRIPSLKSLLPEGEPEAPRGGDPADDDGEVPDYRIHQLRAKAFLLDLEFEE